MTTARIRTYAPSDLAALKEITAKCFPDVSIDRNIERRFGVIGGVDWKQRKLAQIDGDVAANPGGVFVAESDGEVVGYISTRTSAMTKIGGIPNLAVLPSSRGEGLGRRLINRALDYFREQGMLFAKIETLEQNEIGSSFYPGMGFEEVARQIHYVRPL